MRPAPALLAFLLFLAVTLGIVLPALPFLTTQIIGSGGDPWQTMGRFEEQASRIGGLEFWSDFLGGGEPRLINYSTLLWLPLQILFGQPLAYNLAWIMSFVLSGFCMYLLVRYLVSNEWAAVLSGLYYMLLPYHLAHAHGHFGAMQLQWLPLAILLFIAFLRTPRLAVALGFITVFIVQSWTEHHYALWLSMFLVLYTAFHWQQVKRIFREQKGALFAGLSLFFLFVFLPYWPTIRLAGETNSLLELGQAQTIRFSADLISYVTPALFGAAMFTGNATEATHYVGLVALLLIIFFRQRIPAGQYYFWLTVAAFFLVVSLGPRLHVLGHVLPVPLPYALVDGWPVFSSIRAVARASVMVGVACAVLLGWVVATQVRRPWIVGVLALLLMADFYWGALPTQSARISPAYSFVAELPGERLIELPAPTNYIVSSRALYASQQHGKEVVGSIALERAADAALLQEVRSLPALRQLLYLRTGQLRLDRPDFFDQALPETVRETMEWLDVGAIIIHRDSVSTLQLAALTNFLSQDLGLVATEFNDVIVYPVGAEQRGVGDGIFIARDGRWQNVGFDEERASVFAEIENEAGLTLYNVRNVSQTVRLVLPIAPSSHGTLLFHGENTNIQLQGREGDTVTVEVEVKPHTKQEYSLRNQLTQKIIFQNPSYEVINH